jgi:hypothetical protein
MCVCACVRDTNDCLSVSDAVLCYSVNGHNAQVELAAGCESRTDTREEQRANSNVTNKRVPAEPLAVEDPSAGGWAGYSQQIRYATAPTRAYHVSVRPQAAHDNNSRARQICI